MIKIPSAKKMRKLSMFIFKSKNNPIIEQHIFNIVRKIKEETEKGNFMFMYTSLKEESDKNIKILIKLLRSAGYTTFYNTDGELRISWWKE